MVLAEYFDADVLVDSELGEVMNTAAGHDEFQHVLKQIMEDMEDMDQSL